jgi:DNA polymerase III subunit delta'
VSAGRFLGQARVRSLLERALKQEQIPPAFLFSGAWGVGREEAALALAQALNCEALHQAFSPAPQMGDLFGGTPAQGALTLSADPARLGGCGQCGSCRRIGRYRHPDVRVRLPLPRPEPKRDEPADPAEALAFKADHPWEDPPRRGNNPTIGIADVRALIRELAYPPVEGRWRVIILRDADRLGPQAQNALLKSLEEPPARTTFILIAERLQVLLPTVRSRLRPIWFAPLKSDEIEAGLIELGHDPEQARQAALLARGSMRRGMRIIGREIPERGAALQLLNWTAQGRHREALGWAAGWVFKSGGNAWEQARNLLDELISLLRDIAALQAGGSTPLMNADQTDRLAAISSAAPPGGVVPALEAAERARGEVDSFLNLALIYATLTDEMVSSLAT